MWETIKNLISGLAALARFTERKQELQNAPEIKANAEAQRDAEIRDAANAAVRKDDLDEIRRQAAE